MTLEDVAQQYRANGYTVVVHPQREQLPPFAADFDVQILATRAGVSALVLVKNDRIELRASPHVLEQARITGEQPGWRYDFAILNGTDPRLEALSGGATPTHEQIEQMLAEGERAALAGADRAGFLLAWAGLEAAMRDLAGRAGLGGRVGVSAGELIGQLTSWGYLSREDERRLDGLRDAQVQLVHGLIPAAKTEVRDVVRLGRQLLAQTEVGQMAG